MDAEQGGGADSAWPRTRPRSAPTGPGTTPTAPPGSSAPRPSSELCELVAASTAVRALGSRHSFSDLADTTGTLVDLSGLPAGIRLLDDAAGSPVAVSVGGGTRYGDLAVALARRRAGRSRAMASLPHISVAGAVATGTHGSGDRTRIAGRRRARRRGRRRRRRRCAGVARGDEDFDGSVVALGALGVVTRLELDVEPTYEVSQEVRTGLTWAGAREPLRRDHRRGLQRQHLHPLRGRRSTRCGSSTGWGRTARRPVRHRRGDAGCCTCSAAGRRRR